MSNDIIPMLCIVTCFMKVPVIGNAGGGRTNRSLLPAAACSECSCRIKTSSAVARCAIPTHAGPGIQIGSERCVKSCAIPHPATSAESTQPRTHFFGPRYKYRSSSVPCGKVSPLEQANVVRSCVRLSLAPLAPPLRD